MVLLRERDGLAGLWQNVQPGRRMPDSKYDDTRASGTITVCEHVLTSCDTLGTFVLFASCE